MEKVLLNRHFYLVVAILGIVHFSVFSDDAFNRLMQAKRFSEAVSYADANIPPGARPVEVWVKVGFANEAMNLLEKALASYIVATRIDPKSYDAYLGVARVYNTMKRPEAALTFAKKAMDIKPGGAASWEYAKACFALKKPEQAKEALEKTLEFDPNNSVASKGLAEIYWKEKSYEKAIPLLKAAYASNPNAEDAYRIGRSLYEANKYDSAMYFLKDAVSRNPSLIAANLDLARTYYQKNKHLAAASEYEKLAGKIPFTPMDHYFRAVSNEKTGNSESALKSYRAAAEGFGGTDKSEEAVAVHLKVGKIDLEAKNYDAALAHFRVVAAADPEGDRVPDIDFLLAEAYDGSGNIPKAIASLEKALSEDKGNVEAYARLADLYQKNNMPDKAKSIFEKCITLKPNDPKIYLTLGEYNLKAKKYEDAMAYFQKSHVIQNSGSAAAGLAAAAFALGKMEKALDAAESALRLSPSLVEPRIVLYKCYMKNKNYGEAREQLAAIVDKKPTEIEYWKALVECNLQLKDTAHCIDADKKIIELEKNNVQSRQRLGAFLLASRDYAKALPIFKELAVLTPRNADVFKSLYTIANNNGDKQEALGYMKKYCALRPDDASAQKYIGGVYYDLKNYDAALDAFRKTVKQDPTVKGVYKPYAEIVIAKGLTDEIPAAVSGAIQTGEATGSMYAALAAIYQKQGQYDKAIANYQKASELDPRNIQLILSLARCNEKAGHTDEAISFYGQALAFNPAAAGDDYKTLGILLLKRNKKIEAIDAFKKYLSRNKPDNTAARNVADFAYAQKNFEEAARYYSMLTGDDAKRPDVLFSYGQSCYNLKDFKKAFELLSKLATITPQNAEVFRLLHLITSQDERQKNASAEYLGRYLALKPADATSQRSLGDMLYERKDFEGALRAYRKAVSLDPAIKGIYKRYYEVALSAGSNADIETALAGSIGSGEAEGTMYVQLGSMLEKKMQYAKALENYQKAQQADPENDIVASSIARCQMKMGKISEAILSYQKVTALNPKAVEEYRILGELFQKQNKPDLAMEEFKRYLAKKPNDPAIAMLVAETAIKNDDYSEADKYLSGIEKEKARDPVYLFLYGKVNFSLGKYQQSVEAFEQIRAMESPKRKVKSIDRTGLLRMLAESYQKLNDNARASAVYSEYTASADVKDPDMLFKMAQMQESVSPLSAARLYERNTIKFPKEYRNYYEAARLYSKQPATRDKAISLIKKCIAFKDTVPFLWQILGRLYGEMGKTALELDAYRKYIQKDTPNADICEDIGTSLFKRNIVNESIVYLELACALKPEDPDFLYQLARGYEKTNRLSDALPLLKKADQLNPGQEKIQTFLNYIQLRLGSSGTD